jgi:hypothetical protein
MVSPITGIIMFRMNNLPSARRKLTLGALDCGTALDDHRIFEVEAVNDGS